MKLLNILNKAIEYSFYLLFFLVPLALTGDTSELFEFNKLWVTFILTIVIGAAWILKMVIKKEFRIQKTPLDIPIALFLGAQILATIFSIDSHISLWGYYSRFNGGLFSILSYVFLYYAFVSNYKDLNKDEEAKELNLSQILLFLGAVAVFFLGNFLASTVKPSGFSEIPFQMLISLVTAVSAFGLFIKAIQGSFLKKSLFTILISAVIVILWGLPSRFGYDPTCLLFRGTLDVACWTTDFQPKIRVFSTLGQPAWLAAYIAAIIPLSIAFLINFAKEKKIVLKKNPLKNYNLIFVVANILFIIASYLMLLWTLSRGAVIAMWLEVLLLASFYFWFFVKPKLQKKNISLDFKVAGILLIAFLAITFINGQPFSFLNIFTLSGIQQKLTPTPVSKEGKELPAPSPTPVPAIRGELGGTDSGTIRLYVWKGAIDIWKNYPIFGSGLETYAFAYYKYRPVGHNMTSEWNFLYNKAHNEFLNYLATTGTVGIASYLLMIGYFLYLLIKYLITKLKNPNKEDLLIYSLLMGYLGILITNFFGFSVVYINILFYLFPAFFFILSGKIDFEKSYLFSFNKDKKETDTLSNPQKAISIIVLLMTLYTLFVLGRFWQADRYYYLGYNLDRSQDYQGAYQYLQLAANTRPSEPVFKDELALNNTIIGSAIIYQTQSKPDKQSQKVAKDMIDNSIKLSDSLVADYPNNIVFLKTRVRIFYTLSQIDPQYAIQALETVKKAQTLAPTDADVSYNLGVLTGQTGDIKKGVEILENTTKLKPNYTNAYYALGIFYHELAVDENEKLVNRDYAKKAIDKMQFLIDNFGENEQAKAAIDTWQKQL